MSAAVQYGSIRTPSSIASLLLTSLVSLMIGHSRGNKFTPSRQSGRSGSSLVPLGRARAADPSWPRRLSSPGRESVRYAIAFHRAGSGGARYPAWGDHRSEWGGGGERLGSDDASAGTCGLSNLAAKPHDEPRKAGDRATTRAPLAIGSGQSASRRSNSGAGMARPRQGAGRTPDAEAKDAAGRVWRVSGSCPTASDMARPERGKGGPWRGSARARRERIGL